MSLAERAAALATAHQPLRRARTFTAPLLDIKGVSSAIARATSGFRAFESQRSEIKKAGEWFLDNHYLISRTLRQTETEIPEGFRRRLPFVAQDAFPRVLRLAEALVEETLLDFDESALISFVEGYQVVASLTIAELWALPAMLRIATLAELVRCLDVFFAPPRSSRGVNTAHTLVAPEVGVERAVRTLRLLSELDWKSFVQRTSAVEKALLEDPTGVYARMDFGSRDMYRRAVESLAWDTALAEPEIARVAVELATTALTTCPDRDRREGHVGYYLVDGGLSQLKARITYRGRGIERLREIVLSHPTLSYFGSGAASLFVVLILVLLPAAQTLTPTSTILLALLLAVPSLSIAVALTNRWVSRVVAPRLLPKLDFALGAPSDCRTLLVIPALVQSTNDFDRLLAQLELHYLSAPDSSLAFALLTDHVDSARMPDDSALLAYARATVDALNTKYALGAIGPFHVLHRESKWNEGERSFMGWERKRGKLEELNRLLRGDKTTSYKAHIGAPAGLESVRFVITLDSDTQLPLGAARRLIGLAAHPLNTARFDAVTERVNAGYTVAQPRVEPSPVDGASSIFSRLWCGDTSLDIYSSAASDVYQDLFGSGAYVGKGIYEVDSFMRSTQGRAPPNAIASHDLFEGVHGRAALATDILVFEQYPQSYLSFLRRMHRWIRGDWQLLPWLFPRVPSSRGVPVRNPLSVVDRWKIFDNLRRSWLAPNIVLLFFFAWAVLPTRAAALMLLPLVLPLGVAAPALFNRDWQQVFGRWALGVVFLPVEAWVAADAVIRAVVRMTITRKHLLQWVTAADTTLAFAKGSRRLFWREMGPPAVATTTFGCLMCWLHPNAIQFAIPVVLAWLLSPELARWASALEAEKKPLSAVERSALRQLARRTWLFFETFVGPDDQWLAPDNFQEEPGGVVAHRTSPTNIGLMLVSELSAYDLGYIGRAELSALVHRSLETLGRLERYRGHWYNWFDTRTLEPLLPKYVSTVDSGNLAAALLVLAKGCRDAATNPTLRPIRFQGLGDTLDLLEQTVSRLRVAHPNTMQPIAAMRRTIAGAHEDVSTSRAATAALSSDLNELEGVLLNVLEGTTTTRDTIHFREAQTWLDRFRHQLRSLHGDLDAQSTALSDELLALADRIDAARYGIDFRFLFDTARKLFHIGYNATSDRLDENYYDLLASEARLASYLAVVHGQVPPEHWLILGRPVTRIRGEAALLSWGGTMFEFLMPTLFMRSQERTLLQQTAELAIVAQIEHGKKFNLPWGVSESGYAQLDAQNNYQYRSFGVHGLGLRRGLEEDQVVAPYACVLALPFRPDETIRNIKVLQSLGAAALYGLYEALDYDATRVSQASRTIGKPSSNHSVVRSHMAHHQGMILAALNNALNDDVLVERFHADPHVKNGEPLLSERVPSVRIAEHLAGPTKEPLDSQRTAVSDYPGWIPQSDRVQVALLGNGSLTTAVTDSGAGFTEWNGLAIVRGSVDATCDSGGTWIYLRDKERNRMWSAAPAPTRARRADDEVVFSAHQVEFHHRDEGISVRTEIACGAFDDVEVRHVTLHNETDEPRTITLTTYAEPVLESAAASDREPAFSRMFVACEALPAQHALLAARRARTEADPTAILVQSLVWDDPAIAWAGAEMDRRAFIGRRRDARAPNGMVDRDKDDATLDPALVLSVKVRLAPRARAEVALVTVVGKTRDVALDLARRFGSLRAARWVAHDARMEAARRLARDGVSPLLLPNAMMLISRLLTPRANLSAVTPAASRALPSKSNLWGHRISGDFPLLVVRVRDRSGNALIRELLATYRLLRAYGRRIEVVFLDDALTGYQSEEPGSVRNLMVTGGVSAWLDQRAGIFVLATDQVSANDREQIAESASVLLDSMNGSLAEQLASLPTIAPPLPLFAATRRNDVPTHVRQQKPKLMFENAYGGFTEDGREYVICTGASIGTPAPWCNMLANAEAGCLVSESSLGMTWASNSGENRLTPWRNDPVGDAPAEALYLRDEETAQVWSPTPLPAGLDVDTLVRHGAGYTSYERDSHGLSQILTVFVPIDSPVKILKLKLTNNLPRPRRLTATYYVEWVLGAIRGEQAAHIVCELDASAQCLLARCGWNVDFADRVAFLSTDRPLHGFTFDRTEFLGRSGSMSDPEALRRWGLSGSTDGAVDPCGALQSHLELAPGESITTHFVLGQGRDKAQAMELARRFRSPEAVEAALKDLHFYWDQLLGAVTVKTPEPAMDLLLNRWLLYQTLSSRLFARTAFYQSSGAFGYRDQLQDVMALMHSSPQLARAHILVAASHQFEEGDVMHWWHPPADRGVRTRCSDDMAWLPFVTAHYVEATGDDAILDERMPFLKATPLLRDEHDRYTQFTDRSEPATLREHCTRSLKRALTHGPHGLPLMGDGDWNDGMNLVGTLGRGESVWLGFFLAKTLNDFARVCDRTKIVGETADHAADWRAHATTLGTRLDSNTWDGAWYLRAFFDDGTPLGTARARACRIDSISQSWAVLSNIVDPVRTEQALRSADDLLVNEEDRLVHVLTPPFDGESPNPGYIQAYPRGVRENGGQYTHAATWLGFAHAHVHDGERAERIFRLLNPILHGASESKIESYRIEPYVLAGDVYGASPFVGRGGWSWYTGAAAWMWRLGVEEILGLRKRNGGLFVDPCIPRHWPGFEATVQVGQQTCHVVVDNTNGIGHGIASVTLDGKAITTPFIPVGAGTSPRELRIVLELAQNVAE